MWNRERLVAHVAVGHAATYLFFWGHTPKRAGVLDAACLSQWYPASFVVNGVTYATAEHYMMAEKARLFRDEHSLVSILRAKTPEEAKALGRGVRDYDDDAWSAARSAAVVQGNVAKFGQNGPLRDFLRATGKKVLVEASPRDTIWGIGLGASNAAAKDPSRWRGLNLLGFALMEAREQLA